MDTCLFETKTKIVDEKDRRSEQYSEDVETSVLCQVLSHLDLIEKKYYMVSKYSVHQVIHTLSTPALLPSISILVNPANIWLLSGLIHKNILRCSKSPCLIRCKLNRHIPRNPRRQIKSRSRTLILCHLGPIGTIMIRRGILGPFLVSRSINRSIEVSIQKYT